MQVLTTLLVASHWGWLHLQEGGHRTFPVGSEGWWISLGGAVFLIVFGGVVSGLEVALTVYSHVDLEVFKRSGTELQRLQASWLIPVVKLQHQLLVTMLLTGSLAAEALPLFLEKMVDPLVAVGLSTTFVLTFREVIPHALCHKYALWVGSTFIWLVHILLFLFWPICYPIGKFLDHVIGHQDHHLFQRNQLKALVDIHSVDDHHGGSLSRRETKLIGGALDLVEKKAVEAMTPLESTFSLPTCTILNKWTIKRILAKGHSRIPVYRDHPSNIVGILMVKSLVEVHPEDNLPITKLTLRRAPAFDADMPLYEVLEHFQGGCAHMAVVVQRTEESPDATEPTNAQAKQNGHYSLNIDGRKDDNHTGHGPTAVSFTLAPSPSVRAHHTRSEEHRLSQQELEDGIKFASDKPRTKRARERWASLRKKVALALLTKLKIMAANGEELVIPPEAEEEHGKKMERCQAGDKHREIEDQQKLRRSEKVSSTCVLDDHEILGIITMEDVIEELMQEKFVKEKHEDVEHRLSLDGHHHYHGRHGFPQSASRDESMQHQAENHAPRNPNNREGVLEPLLEV